VLVGLTWGALILEFAPHHIGWLLPGISGMVLSVPLTMFASRIAPAHWLRRLRLLLALEETDLSAELAALQTRLFRLAEPPAVGEAAAARELKHRVPARAPLAMKTQPLNDAIAAHRWRWPIPWRKN
jgi:membrane glycosyltransferase